MRFNFRIETSGRGGGLSKKRGHGHVRQLGDIDVAVTVDRDAMRRNELRIARAALFAEPRENLALRIEDRNARAEIGHVFIHPELRAYFGDEEQALSHAHRAQGRCSACHCV